MTYNTLSPVNYDDAKDATTRRNARRRERLEGKERRYGLSQKPRKPLGFSGRQGLKRSRLKTKRPAQGSRRAIKTQCDDLVRDILKLRDSRCVIFGCGQTEGLHVGHYITRKVLALRWDLRNCNLQCDPHNGAHNIDPKPYQKTMFFRYGIGVTWQIEMIAQENPHLEYSDLLEIRDGLRAELKRIEAAQKAKAA